MAIRHILPPPRTSLCVVVAVTVAALLVQITPTRAEDSKKLYDELINLEKEIKRSDVRGSDKNRFAATKIVDDAVEQARRAKDLVKRALKHKAKLVKLFKKQGDLEKTLRTITTHYQLAESALYASLRALNATPEGGDLSANSEVLIPLKAYFRKPGVKSSQLGEKAYATALAITVDEEISIKRSGALERWWNGKYNSYVRAGFSPESI